MPQWVRVGSAYHNNCTDFAFEGYDDLVFENDLDTLIQKASRLGWRETNSTDDANVILYGSINSRGHAMAYSHAIRKVRGVWEEVLGNDHNRWNDPFPPPKHSGDFIVSMLRAP